MNVEKQRPHTLLVRNETAHLLWKTIWVLKKGNIELQHNPAIQLQDTYPGEMKFTYIQKIVHAHL